MTYKNRGRNFWTPTVFVKEPLQGSCCLWTLLHDVPEGERTQEAHGTLHGSAFSTL